MVRDKILNEIQNEQQLVLLVVFVTIVVSVFISATTVFLLDTRTKDDEIHPVINRTVNRIVERIIEIPDESGGEPIDVESERKKLEKEFKELIVNSIESERPESSSCTVGCTDIQSSVETLKSSVRRLASAIGETIWGVVVNTEGQLLTTGIQSTATVYSQGEESGGSVYIKERSQSPYSWLQLEAPSENNTFVPIATKEQVALGAQVVAFEQTDAHEKISVGYISSITPSGIDGIMYIQSVFYNNYIPSPSTVLMTDSGDLIGIYAQKPFQVVIPLYSLSQPPVSDTQLTSASLQKEE